MKALRLIACVFVAFFSIAAADPAFALANRVFVSARSGNDANSCDNVLTPCKTFAGAVVQLNPGGEAIVLDSGGYGPVTITQSLTIEAPPGVLAFIHPPSGDAITISAGSSDVVTVRGLVLNGGSGLGMTVGTVGVLHVENCVISGFLAQGIHVSGVNARVFINDTVVRENNGGLVFSAGRATLDHCRAENNVGIGIFADGADVSVRDSVSAGNDAGFAAESVGTENSILNVDHCISTNNGADGFFTQKGGSGVVKARLSNSSISENIGHGIANGTGVLFESLGNNLVRGNVGGDVSGAAITVVGGQ